jgi:hypothetical protein
VLRTRLAGSSMLVALALVGGCDTRVIEGPVFQPQVINVPNDFAFQANALDGVNGVREYTWQSDGSAATVNQLPNNLTGTVSLFILDGAGTQVYQHALTDTGTFTTAAGVAGSWTVRVRMEDASGSVTFHVRKP